MFLQTISGNKFGTNDVVKNNESTKEEGNITYTFDIVGWLNT
jgi:hypothetical protein